jgi:hypothetical protein
MTGCATFRVSPPPSFHGQSSEVVLRRARDNNQLVRVHSDSTVVVGRVRFIEANSVFIERTPVSITSISDIEYFIPIDLGGKRAGLIGGAVLGVLVGLSAREFWEFGYEQTCDLSCTARVFVPAFVATTIVGTLVGSLVDPSERRWTSVWRPNKR